MLNQSQIEQIINEFKDPSSQMTLGESKARVNIKLEGDKLNVALTLGYPAKGYVDSLQAELKALLAEQTGLTDISLTIDWKITKHKVQQGVQAINNIKNIIAVASGKGGVGKSTTSVNLALALVAEGANVGLLDADIYGPSQPRMLGTSQRPESSDGKSIEPIERYGLQSMSIGYLIDEEEPMIWRGPMLTQALEQMLKDTNWKDLDYLVIDLPPGTGDIQLTLSQKVPVSSAVIITTPQDISLLDARKALKMFEKVNVPVMGIIENMSTHVCSQCGHEEHIFGAGGGEKMAEQYDIDLLGSLPLDIKIREDADGGQPTVVADPEGPIAMIYRNIARQVAARLAKQGKDFSTVFPNIVIKND
ncbi:MAG: iron-sulfur cluster carrier protein ApbC [Gammaproteobacteria bacterium]|nr:MAG: iron-sulfur cluster carrier protein ApbC [Gammaproteobacteria bacterium]RKZ91446.1 MAG: iron-sulfur cluster carrier protein ApbC [Gammaproteobacteria bacterium]RKZ97082.1 MAG: iron-sulfur cluster carrier protein ApbC [Gammaproteobacteria bacterium]